MMHFNLKNKKASLNLSVNAIVVLILAITMLGLGLGFMKGMFGKITTKIDTAIGSTEILIHPSVDEPFVISSKKMTLRRGYTETIQVGYYNEEAFQQSIALFANCTPKGINLIYYGDGGTYDGTKITGTIELRAVEPAEVAGWNVLVSVNTSASLANYGCLAVVNSSTLRYVDFFVTVQ